MATDRDRPRGTTEQAWWNVTSLNLDQTRIPPEPPDKVRLYDHRGNPLIVERPRAMGFRPRTEPK